MARLSGLGPEQRVDSDIRDMEVMQANTWQELYRDYGIGLAVNDGKFLTRINDREEVYEKGSN